MNVYKIYNKEKNLWYRGSSNWIDNEESAKPYRRRNNATSAIGLCYPKPSEYRFRMYSERSQEIIDIRNNIEIVEYELVEKNRTKL